MCFHPTATSEQECNDWATRVNGVKDTLGNMSKYSNFGSEWESSYAAGAGRCLLKKHRSWDVSGISAKVLAGYNGWGEGDTWYWNSESDYGNVHDTLASKFTRRRKIRIYVKT